MIQDDILPLLEEYCYEDYTTLAKILGSGLVDERNQRIRHELFEPAKKNELVQALLSIDPDIIATPQAVSSETVDLDEDTEGNNDLMEAGHDEGQAG